MLARFPPGLCVLTPSGELGLLEPNGHVRNHPGLTTALSSHVAEFLAAYQAGPDRAGRRAAVLHFPSGDHPWETATLSLEDDVVRNLFPAGGRTRSELTSFQQRQRHRSVFRGLELMIEFRREGRPSSPVYCPVLYAEPARLAGRSAALGREPTNAERDSLVIDVLNLAALGDQRTFDDPAIVALNEFLHERLIDKSQRRKSGLEVQQTDYVPDSEPERIEPDLGHVTRWTLMDDVTLPQVDLYRPHDAERVDHIECWLRQPSKPVNPDRLREFVQFSEMENAALLELAARSLLYSAPGGVLLLDVSMTDAWNMYLLEGAIMLTAPDGATLRIDGGSDKARFPISFLKPRKYRVEALSPIQFIWVHDMLLAAVHAPQVGEAV